MLFLSLLVSLIALPVAAQQDAVEPARICGQLPSEMMAADGRPGSIQPLQPQERLVYSLAGLTEGTVEIRYRIRGEVKLTEVVDLSTIELPRRMGTPRPDEGELRGFVQKQHDDAGATQPRRPERVQGERVMELLALHPDTVRELHRLAGEGVAIEIEVSHNGQVRETLSFAELTKRNATMRERAVLPVVVRSQVSGPALVAPPKALRTTTNEYLESCGDCTASHPCSTECGYDPGKGGPVTCGEQGMPCEAYCSPSWSMGDYAGPWQFYGGGNTGWSTCYMTNSGISKWHNEYVTVYRRDIYRRTMNCPNSPSCNGCYESEQLIAYQYWYVYCYYETAWACGSGYMPCCSNLCTVYSWTLCEDGWPCS